MLGLAAVVLTASNAFSAYIGDTQSLMSQCQYTGGSYGYVWTQLVSPRGKIYQDTTYLPTTNSTGTHYSSKAFDETGAWHFQQWSRMTQSSQNIKNQDQIITVVAKTCVIAVNVAPASNYGTAGGGGTVNIGQSVTLSAWAAAGGYKFRCWTINASEGGGGTVVSWSGQGATSSSYTFTASANATYYANFSPPQYYTLSVSINGSGSVNPPSGTKFLEGTTIYPTATNGTGYSFASWGGALSGSANSPALLMDTDKAITATFNVNYYNVAIATNGTGSGSVPGAGYYAYGTTPSFTATPAAGSYFAGWSGAASGGTNPVGVYIDGNKSLTATFNAHVYTISTATAPAGLGTVTGGGNYTHGQSTTLTAPAVGGYTFSGWSGAGLSGTTNPIGLSVTGSNTVTASYSRNRYTVTTTTGGDGTGSVSGAGPYDYGANATMTATPAVGSTFAGWSGALSGTTNPQSFTVTGNATATATFTLKTFTLTTNTSGSGSVTAGGTYPFGTVRSITATPGVGQHFTGWSGAASGTTNPINVTIDGNETLTATFAPNRHAVSATTTGEGSGSVSGAAQYSYGDAVTMTATPATGSSFVGWSGALSGGTNPQSFTVTADASVAARFDLNTYTVATQTSPAGLGIVSGGGRYAYGRRATLTAPGGTGYTFTGWSGSLSGTTNPESLVVDGEKSVTANYRINRYVLKTDSNGSGSVTAGGEFPYGTVRSVTATPAAKHRFTGWSGAASGTANPIEITMDSNKSVTAAFEPNTATVSVATATHTYDGQPKRLEVSTSPAGLTCTVTYEGAATAPAEVGEYHVVATVDDATYQGSGAGTLRITRATPLLRWPGPTPITYPTPLSSAQLNATADVSGAFVYSPAAGTVLDPGAGQQLSVSFAPADSRNYATTAATNHVDVNPADQTVTISPASSVVAAGTSVAFSASGGANGYTWGGAASGSGPSQTVAFPLPGGFDVTAYSPAGGVYARSNTGTAHITVNAVPQTVVLSPAMTLLEPQRSVVISAAGGRNGYVWGGSATGSGESKTLAFATPGSYAVNAYSPAGGAFLESNRAAAQITVAYAQTISFPPPGSFVLRAVGTNLMATASSGLPVRFTVISGPGVLTGARYLQFTALGAIVVQADQDGDANYSAAPPVRQTVPVNAPPVTTLQFPAGKTGLIHGDHQDTNQALPERK